MAKRRVRHEEHEEHENHERWLVTYADMITLLMVLFIVLYSIGQTDLAKFEQLKDSLHSSFAGSKPAVIEGSDGVLDGGGGPAALQPAGDIVEQATQALDEEHREEAAAELEGRTLAGARDRIVQDLQAAGLAADVRLRLEQRGLVVSVVTDRVLFDSGAATLRPEGQQVLAGLAAALGRLPNDITIEGHTDDRPTRGGFATNWELSTSRATSVLRYLTVTHGVPAARLSAAGYADQRPLVPNDSEAHRATNRRVEIVVLARTELSATATT